MKLNSILILGLFINLFFSLLPIYDTINIFTLLNLGVLSYQNNIPILHGTTNPSGFFITILLIPMGYIYANTLNTYYTALTLKLLLFFFFFLFVIMIIKLFDLYDLEEKEKKFMLTLILFNPGLIFVNFIWAELVILPVFFTTLAFYIIKAKPFNTYGLNLIFSMISIYIGIFFFLYPIIFIPTLILYSGKTKERVYMLITSVFSGFSFLFMQVIFFQGYFFNYVGSLSGSNKNLVVTQLNSGFFFFASVSGEFKTIIELLLLLLITVMIPFVLKHFKFSEVVVLYLVSALFIFISLQIDMDNFLFLLPFVFLAPISISKKLKPHWVMLATSILYIPILFAPIYYYHNYVYGFYYWFYPLTHNLGPVVSTSFINRTALPIYNYTFAIYIVILITFYLLTARYSQKRIENYDKKLINNKFKPLTKKILAILIVLVLLPIPLSLIYNNANNSVHIEKPSEFPLLYFYPEFRLNSSFTIPIGQIPYSYSINGSSLIIPNSTRTLFLERNISRQAFKFDAKFNMLSSDNSNFTILKTNNWKLTWIQNNTTHDIILNTIGVKSLISLGNRTNFNISFVDDSTHSTIRLGQYNFSLEPSSYIYFGKTKNTNTTIKIEISKLIISYNNGGGYYLVPAFLSFYYPLLFSTCSVIWILYGFNRTGLKR